MLLSDTHKLTKKDRNFIFYGSLVILVLTLIVNIILRCILLQTTNVLDFLSPTFWTSEVTDQGVKALTDMVKDFVPEIIAGLFSLLGFILAAFGITTAVFSTIFNSVQHNKVRQNNIIKLKVIFSWHFYLYLFSLLLGFIIYRFLYLIVQTSIPFNQLLIILFVDLCVGQFFFILFITYRLVSKIIELDWIDTIVKDESIQ